MTKSVAPSLDELLKSDSPAWLWDGERSRIVWANVAGTSWFGVETLFDLLEVRFADDELSIATIKDLSARLPRREKATEIFKFAAAATDEQLTCDCHVHTLADGRAGLLVCGKAIAQSTDNLPGKLQAMALEAFPMPVCVVTGSGSLVFANEALQQTLPANADFDFARAMIKKSHDAGLTSGLKTIDTKHGKRDMQIVARPLDKTDRLADTNFLLVLEDVTERRSLERSLLAVADEDGPVPENVKEANSNPSLEPKSENVDAEVAKTLSALRTEIENQTQKSDEVTQAPKSETRKQDSTVNKNNKQSVPEIISKTLNEIAQPIVLINDAGALVFGNESAVELMETESWQDIGKVTSLGDALAALEGEDGAVSVFTAKDEALNLEASLSKFPWPGGSVLQVRLTLENDGEEADNRRNGSGSGGGSDVKKNIKKNNEEVTLRPLRVTDDVSITDPLPTKAETEQGSSPSDEELRAILDTATDGIITLDRKGKICSFSAGAEALFGHHSSDVTGKSFAKLLAGDSRKVIKDYLDALSGSGLAAVFNDGREVEAKVKQGGIISLFLTIGLLDTARSKAGISDEGIAAFCVVVRDITQWKNTEAELRLSKESAEQSNAQKSLFLANISHELRTPLNAIMGFSEVMRSERFGEIENEKYLAYANDIHSSGGHLLALINDLLDLAKVESGKLELNFTSVNLLNVIDDAMNSLQEEATSNRILLRKSAGGKLPNVVADMRSMKQILLNLLSNSVKFTKPGGQVIVSAKLEDNGELLVTVKDTGEGMNNEQLQRALEPFQQIKSSGKSETPGTGLGLPLTKALVEANRANFTITSAPKKGTLVEIVFPTTRVLAE